MRTVSCAISLNLLINLCQISGAPFCFSFRHERKGALLSKIKTTISIMSSTDVRAKGPKYQSEIESIPGVGAPWRAEFLYVVKELEHIIPSLVREVTPTGKQPDLHELWKSIQHCLSLIPKWEEQLHVALGEICEAKVKWN